MATKLSEEEKASIQQTGYGIAGSIGGAPKRRYWTPDGREIFALPSIRQFSRKSADGSVITGERDGNYDNGWLDHKPSREELKKYCPHCDRWHDTQLQVNECGRKRKALISKYSRDAKKELKTADDERISKLESDMGELKGMFKQLMEKMK